MQLNMLSAYVKNGELFAISTVDGKSTTLSLTPSCAAMAITQLADALVVLAADEPASPQDDLFAAPCHGASPSGRLSDQ